MSRGSETALSDFPFSALVGYESPRRALLCLTVDPGLGGAVLQGTPGSGRRLLVESFLGFTSRHALEHDVTGRIPTGLDPLRLEGGVDLERSLLAGHPVRRRGLLHRHTGGVILIEHLDGLDLDLGACLSRWLEAEGRGTRFLAFADQRQVRAEGFQRRLAFHLSLERPPDESARASLLARRLRFDAAPAHLIAEWETADAALARSVVRAREILPGVAIPESVREAVAAAGLARQLEDLRREMLTLRAARAHAALAGRNEVLRDDLQFAEAMVRGASPPDEAAAAPPPPGRRAPSRSDAGESREDGASASTDSRGPTESRPQSLVQTPRAAELPEIPLATSRETGVARRGRRGRLDSWQRGRAVRTLSGSLTGRRLALEATLREAALHQRHRKPRRRGVAIEVRREDVRIRRFREKAGTLFILAVDASGSMAANRMREAKGAALALLRDAYVNRDAVALIAVSGERARLLLPPTTSLARARRELEILPTGGGTPLASGLTLVTEVAAAERRRSSRRVLAVLMTDGRGNVPLDPLRPMAAGERAGVVDAEMEALAKRYREARIDTVVVDTTSRDSLRSPARTLARRLHARHCRLSRREADAVARDLRAQA